MSSTNTTVYEEQCERWHNALIDEFEANNTRNLMERLDEIENVVNKGCDKYALTLNGFKIGYSQRQNLLALYNRDLREHTAVNHGKCVKPIKNVTEYKHKARNKLNRWKPKVFGDHVLYEIIFTNAYNYCYEIGRVSHPQWADTQIKDLFVTIFCHLLDAKIRFKKTRDVNLILSTVFSTNTRFRRSCIYFLEHFNESGNWNIKSGKKAVDKVRSFKACLQTVSTMQCVLPPPIIASRMDITENDRRCDIYYTRLIQQQILSLECAENLSYLERISTSSVFPHIVAVINSFFCGAMSFWSMTPRKTNHSWNQINYSIPSVLNQNSNNSYSNSSEVSMNDVISVMGRQNSNSSMHRNECVTNCYHSLSRGTSAGSSNISVDRLPNLHDLNDGNNLHPLVSGEEHNYSVYNCSQTSDWAQNKFHNSYADSQQFIPSIPRPMCHTPHITAELPPPPPPMYMSNNYGTNPHISQELPPPIINPNMSQNYLFSQVSPMNTHIPFEFAMNMSAMNNTNSVNAGFDMQIPDFEMNEMEPNFINFNNSMDMYASNNDQNSRNIFTEQRPQTVQMNYNFSNNYGFEQNGM